MIVNWFIPGKGLSFSKFKKMCGLNPYNYDKHLASVWIRCFELISYLDVMGVKSLINANNEKQLKKNTELEAAITNTETKLNKFRELVERITKKNTFRPYPDIDDIPN